MEDFEKTRASERGKQSGTPSVAKFGVVGFQIDACATCVNFFHLTNRVNLTAKAIEQQIHIKAKNIERKIMSSGGDVEVGLQITEDDIRALN